MYNKCLICTYYVHIDIIWWFLAEEQRGRGRRANYCRNSKNPNSRILPRNQNSSDFSRQPQVPSNFFEVM